MNKYPPSPKENLFQNSVHTQTNGWVESVTFAPLTAVKYIWFALVCCSMFLGGGVRLVFRLGDAYPGVPVESSVRDPHDGLPEQLDGRHSGAGELAESCAGQLHGWPLGSQSQPPQHRPPLPRQLGADTLLAVHTSPLLRQSHARSHIIVQSA